ncbi:MAG: ATP-dependent metallopeptidase FtsH/Yme1/Tma family protein, partial [Pseudomonadota bacterium]
MNSNFRNYALWAIIILLLVALFNLFQGPAQNTASAEVSYSQFLEDVAAGRVQSVEIQGQTITGRTSSGQVFETFAPDDPNLVQTLSERGVNISVSPPDRGSPLLSVLFSWLPLIVILGVWIFFMRQMQGGGNKAMGFGKSKAKLLTEAHGRVTFADVAGVEEAKDDLEEIVEFLRDPQKFQRLGGKIPRGVLLSGPPGTG